MDTNGYLTFLLIAVVLVALDGQIIYRSGRRYLQNSYGGSDAGDAGVAMARLITVMFHFAVLGVVALISTVPMFDGPGPTAIVGRLGIVLLILALAHGVTLSVLAKIRDDQVGETLVTRKQEARHAEVTQGTATWSQNEPVVNPVPGQRGRPAQVSPDLERGATYPMDQ
ncbi:hypothetical protein ACFWY9_11255 [Amycolatopsis sp. NPDC059027]|uniref:hypothetical protein n=1 Tax=unclassified Amycolatopsis TaxID=2618356 RepID=UPI00366CF832